MAACNADYSLSKIIKKGEDYEENYNNSVEFYVAFFSCTRNLC